MRKGYKKVRRVNSSLDADRFSNLPDDAIDNILTHLPLRDAVRTSILKRYWRYRWCNLSNLIFDEQGFPRLRSQTKEQYSRKFVNIVDEILLLHCGPIVKFELSTPFESCRDIDRWIIFLSRNGIKELILRIDEPVHVMPSSLFSCADLSYLELVGCRINPPPSLKSFKALRALNLHYVSISNELLDDLISRCPVLETLVLVEINGCTQFKISGLNLVEVTIHSYFENLWFERTPHLAMVSLKYNVKPDDSYLFHDGSVCKLVQVLGSLPSLERLEVLENLLQSWSVGDVPDMLSTTCQLKYLSININFEDKQELLSVFCIFRSSPFLQKLTIEAASDEDQVIVSLSDYWDAQENFNCFFARLRILKVADFRGTKSEMNFIKFVLANAPVLDRVEIKLEENKVNREDILKQMIKFRRISTAEIEFVD